MIYNDLIKWSQEWEVQYTFANNNRNSLMMLRHGVPISITHREFDHIHDFIRRNNLKYGYEVATGFGISGLAAALAFQNNGGKIVTMDSYIEEVTKQCDKYDYVHEIQTGSDGYKSVHQLINMFGLENVLYPTIGYSPTNTLRCLDSVYDMTKVSLDYIFIDAMHFPNAAKSDIQAILPYINRDKFALFMHDWHCVKSIAPYIKEVLDISMVVVEHCQLPHGYNLAYGGKGCV